MANTHNPQSENPSRTRSRGFASMDPAKQREIASKGGRAAHRSGNAHEFDSDEARKAGSKGGTAAHQRGTAHQFTSEEARRAGSKGGRASRNNNASKQTVDSADTGAAGAQASPSPERETVAANDTADRTQTGDPVRGATDIERGVEAARLEN